MVEREYPTFFLAFASCLCSSFACRFGQTVKVFFVGDVQLECLVLLQQVLGELKR